MKRFVWFLGVVVLSFGLVWLGGCGDDSATNTVVKDEGELDDPVFLEVQDAYYGLGNFGDLLFEMMGGLVGEVLDSASTPSAKLNVLVISTGVASDSVLFTYHSDTKYWYWYLYECDTSIYDTVVEIFTVELKDSIQFLHGTTAVQWPDTTLLTGVKNGARISMHDNIGNELSASQIITITGDLFGTGDVVINGTRGFSATGDEVSTGCSVDANMTSTANNIAGNIEDIVGEGGCPESGRLTTAGTLALECVGDTTFSFSDMWVVSEVFYGDSSVVTFENSTTKWIFTDYCYEEIASSASLMDQLSEAFKKVY